MFIVANKIRFNISVQIVKLIVNSKQPDLGIIWRGRLNNFSMGLGEYVSSPIRSTFIFIWLFICVISLIILYINIVEV